jgi:L-ribulose-5-phosphate 3-epimerase UlaE
MDTSHPKHRLLAPLYRAQQGDLDVLASWRELGFRMITNGVDTTDESLERLEEQIASRQRIIDRVEADG